MNAHKVPAPDNPDVTHNLRYRAGLTEPWELEVFYKGKLHSRTRHASEGKARSSLLSQADDFTHGAERDRNSGNAGNGYRAR